MEGEWFHEKCDLWPGQLFGMKVKAVLHEEQSKYQNIKIIQTETYGRALILDDIIQCTERDEFAYQEMIAFLPLCAHPSPKKVRRTCDLLILRILSGPYLFLVHVVMTIMSRSIVSGADCWRRRRRGGPRSGQAPVGRGGVSGGDRRARRRTLQTVSALYGVRL